jgi:predicted Fe-Mo cluster-binding NifX family protein
MEEFMKRWTVVLGVLALVLISVATARTVPGGEAYAGPIAADTMKIGVASTGSAADAAISQEAARAPYILIFDHAGDLVEVIENRGLPAQRASAQVVLMLKERGVTHFIAGQFGRNLINALNEAGIERLEKTGSAQGAVSQIIG